VVIALLAAAQVKGDPYMLAFMGVFFTYFFWLLWKETR
jgi:hypothetical protein